MNAYDASLGRQAGSTVQMVIKSGASAYHGSPFTSSTRTTCSMANLFHTNLSGARFPDPFHEYGGNLQRPGAAAPGSTTARRRRFSSSPSTVRATRIRAFSIVSLPTELERKGDFSPVLHHAAGRRQPREVSYYI